jgi:hypothetical protein
MDTLSLVDGGTTVVAGSIANRKELRERNDDFPAKPYSPIGTNGVSKARTVGNDFSTAEFAIDRPFFVPIGKEGVTGALQKLDKQLQQVGDTSSHATR